MQIFRTNPGRMIPMIYKDAAIKKLGISGASKKANTKYEANNIKRRITPLNVLTFVIR